MHIAEPATDTLPPFVAKTRSRNPVLKAFGQRLTDLRGKRTRQQISNRLSDLGVPLGGATLAQYEAGTVWAPDPGVLWGLSVIYDRPLEEFILMLRVNRANPGVKEWRDLLRPATDQESNLLTEGGSPDVPASDRARISRLESELADFKAKWGDVQDVARALFRIAVGGAEGDEVVHHAPGRRGVTRKAN